ncbi:MAG: protein kinase domain-containing protein [Polyangiales bacterium]
MVGAPESGTMMIDSPTIRAAGSRETRRFVGPFAHGELLAGVYRVGRTLGSGGMGCVYEAEDVRLQRQVAIKVASDPGHAAALATEARALAAIRHPGVVTVHAMGTHLGHDFLVLERLYGRSLQARLDEAKERKRTFGVDEVLDILIGIADALAAIHRVGIAHRDLKPGNIVLAGARTVLVDFGLFVPEFERHDVIAGSAEFIAPEVVRRNVVPGAGPLIDLYALGIIAFELLAGRTPFVAPTFEQIIRRHVTDLPPSVGELREGVPDALVRLVDELLRKDPLERPSSAEEVLWRLSAIRTPAGLTAGIQPFRVLVVDDDPAIASVLRRALRLALPQLVVEAETHPRDALQEIERTPPDLVLLDLNMPEMNGIEVAMAIAALPAERRPAVIATSSEASDADVAVLRSLGVSTFVPKDARFVARLSSVLTDLRNAQATTTTVASSVSRPNDSSR